MKIKLTSVMVDDQEKALRFYTEILGFIKNSDLPMGEYRWLTIASPDQKTDIELLLEPTAFPPAKTYQKELYKAGIPIAAFAVGDVKREYEWLKKLGVKFTQPPKAVGITVIAVFDDTCGNLIQIYQD